MLATDGPTTRITQDSAFDFDAVALTDSFPVLAPPAPAPAPAREFWKDKGAEMLDLAFHKLMEEEKGLVKDVSTYLTMHERQRHHNSLQLLQQFDEEVFSAIQTDIDAELAKRPSRSLTLRRKASMEDFLRASNSKTTGLYLDVVLPDYNPASPHKHIIRFSSRVENDPCKLELRNSLPYNLEPGVKIKKKEKMGIGGPRLPVRLWDKLDVTPYGRMGQPHTVLANREWKIKNKVLHDQYNYPKDGASMIKEGLMTGTGVVGDKGKRCSHLPRRHPISHDRDG